jgi:hypothetical protein
MLVMFIIPVILYGMVDLRPDIKSGNWKPAIVYMAIATWALMLWICVMRNVPLKSQSDIVESIVKSIFTPLD